MKSKKLSLEAGSLISIISVILILAVLGIFSQGFWHTRMDLTENKQFTLNEGTKNTLKNLPDIVTIHFVTSAELPMAYTRVKTDILDVLEEFEATSKGKLKLKIVDPGDDEEKKKEVAGLGIRELPLQAMGKGKQEMVMGYFGLALTYGDKKEVFPILQYYQSFEFELVVKIKNLTTGVKKIAVVEGSEGQKVGFTFPTQPPQTFNGFDQCFAALKQELDKVYQMSVVNLESQEIADDIDLVIVAAPKKVSDKEKYKLDQYLMKGGSLIFLTPGVEIQIAQGIQGTATNNNYEDLLAKYGLSVKKNIILEQLTWEYVVFGRPFEYPYWIMESKERFNDSSRITKDMQVLTFPWTSSISLDTTNLDSNTKVDILVSSSHQSWEEVGRFNLFPREIEQYVPVSPGSQPLVVMKTGNFQSLYSDRPPPMDSASPLNISNLLRESQSPGRVMVIPNGFFVSDVYLRMQGHFRMQMLQYGRLMPETQNMNFMVNAIDQMALDPDLISIRSRTMENRNLDPEKVKSKTALMIFNFVTIPVILFIIIVILGVRRKNRDAAQ